MAIPRVVPVLTSEIPKIWNQLHPFVMQALEHAFGTYTEECVLRELVKGEAQAFLVIDAEIIGAFITTIQNFPARTALHVPIVAGSRLSDWLPLMHDTTQRFAKASGCTHVTGAGRRGWTKALRGMGWKEELTTISVEVE